MYNPRLVEKNIKDLLNYNLKNCQQLKYKYNSLIYNLLLLFILVSVIGLFLYYKYNDNTKENRINRNITKQEYIMSNLRKYQNIKNKQLTNLPSF